MGWLGRRFYRTTDARIVTISESVKQDLALLEEAPLEAMAVVPNGVDVERFHPGNRERHRDSTRKELGLEEGHIAVLFVGNSWGRKGLRTAIEAVDMPDHANVRLVVVGDGVEAPFLAGLKPEVTARIIFAGAQVRDVERFYAAADIFILPTLYEPFGLVVLEAMASGLPTIVSACAGVAEWLEDGADVVLLRNPEDGAEARAALQSLLRDSTLLARLALNGRSAAEGLQWSGIADRLLETVKPHVLARQKPVAGAREADASRAVQGKSDRPSSRPATG
jgi:UDP-glucose:(heptosyl)LPS alpha-1,3-glucosyltransferase